MFPTVFGPVNSPVEASVRQETLTFLIVSRVAVPPVPLNLFLIAPGCHSNLPIVFPLASVVHTLFVYLPPACDTHLPMSGGSANAAEAKAQLAASAAAHSVPSPVKRLIRSLSVSLAPWIGASAGPAGNLPAGPSEGSMEPSVRSLSGECVLPREALRPGRGCPPVPSCCCPPVTEGRGPRRRPHPRRR